MKLGGLFSGIGGFELAWQRNGGTVAWMCEIDKNARKVLAARFPGVPIYEDVEQLDPAEVEAVDVLTGGSPCQGFSIAGARAGLDHGESRLFADYVRIMDGLADRCLQWAVWDNVPGVLSIKNDDGERTFTHVIGALAGAGVPVRLDPKRKWNAGLVAGAGRAVAWRIVDSRHFGVPQRRRRVYATVALGHSVEGRAGRALLAQPEGVRRDPPACITKGLPALADIEDGTSMPSVAACVTTGTGQRYDPETETILGVEGAGVRRLTPVECERLQAFPDGWTEPAGSDSARYKALGNAVTVNVPQWLFGRMLEVQDDV